MVVGFILGCIASFIIAVWYAWAVQPKLEVREFSGARQTGERDGKHFEFYHVTVTNIPPPRPWSYWLGRQPAWSCRVRVDVLQKDGSPLIENIVGRWSSQPEPTSRTGPMGFPLFNSSLWVQGQRCDVHEYNSENIVVAIKYDGEEECYIFNNDSFRDSTWGGKKPDFEIGTGTFRLKITVLYARKPVISEFVLVNEGPSIDQLTISKGRGN